MKDLYTINTQYQIFAFLSPILYPMQNRVLNKNKREWNKENENKQKEHKEERNKNNKYVESMTKYPLAGITDHLIIQNMQCNVHRMYEFNIISLS